MWNRSSHSDDDLTELWLTESNTEPPVFTQPTQPADCDVLSMEGLLSDLNLTCLQPILEERGLFEIDGFTYAGISKLKLPAGPKRRLLRGLELAISRSKGSSNLFEPGYRYSMLKYEVDSYLAELQQFHSSFHSRQSSGHSKIKTLVAKINQNHRTLKKCMARFQKRQVEYSTKRRRP